MPAQQPGPRHAAPRVPARRRTVLLPGVLLVAAGAAFAGLAALPASAAGTPPRVTAAAALTPVELELSAPNLELMATLAKGLTGTSRPFPKSTVAKPAPSDPATPPRVPARASRDRASGTEKLAGIQDRLSFARPSLGQLTSGYGRRWGRLHAGIDLAAAMGSPVRAVMAGTVQSSGTEGGYGRAIRLLHADGTVTVYGHMSALLVSRGERVVAGEQIGREGSTGQSTGPHLHFEVRINGSPINPIPWLRERGIRI